MTKKDIETEEVIKQAAKRLFFVEGRFNATTQEIADAAGVNRTLLNYYFRSRNKLFDLVLTDARQQFKNKMKFVFQSDVPFREKIERFIEIHLVEALAYPYLETYMVTRLNQQIEQNDIPVEHKESAKGDMKKFIEAIEKAMEKGELQKMDPVQFIWNLMSLLAYPIIMKPVFTKFMDLSEKEYEKLIQDRKDIILSLIFK